MRPPSRARRALNLAGLVIFLLVVTGVAAFYLPQPLPWFVGVTCLLHLANELSVSDPRGCVGCGGEYGHTRYAVWGPEGEARHAEDYCAHCFAQGGWLPGCTFAEVGEVSGWDDFQARAVEAYPHRKPVQEVSA